MAIFGDLGRNGSMLHYPSSPCHPNSGKCYRHKWRDSERHVDDWHHCIAIGAWSDSRVFAQSDSLAPDAPPNMDADELACEVIQRAIKNRAAVLTPLDSPEI
jgi:hypothetical protein